MRTPIEDHTDDRFLHGRDRQALEILPTGPMLERLTEEVRSSFDVHRSTERRIVSQMEKWRAADHAVQTATDEDARAEAALQRSTFAGDLVHAPRDAKAAAGTFAYALLKWAEYVAPAAREIAEAAAQLARPIESERFRTGANLEPNLPGTAVPPHQEKLRLKDRFQYLNEKLRPHAQRRDAALGLECSALYELRLRFGDLGPDKHIYAGEVPRWIDEVRQRVAAQTQDANPLVTDSLRPLGVV
jgi:hypothetical protein